MWERRIQALNLNVERGLGTPIVGTLIPAYFAPLTNHFSP